MDALVGYVGVAYTPLQALAIHRLDWGGYIHSKRLDCEFEHLYAINLAIPFRGSITNCVAALVEYL